MDLYHCSMAGFIIAQGKYQFLSLRQFITPFLSRGINFRIRDQYSTNLLNFCYFVTAPMPRLNGRDHHCPLKGKDQGNCRLAQDNSYCTKHQTTCSIHPWYFLLDEECPPLQSSVSSPVSPQCFLAYIE
jgi:hypothetical protein